MLFLRHLLKLLLFLLSVQLLIMRYQLIHVPWLLASYYIEWRTGVEDPEHFISNGQQFLLGDTNSGNFKSTCFVPGEL
jgi:hypothetical protein